MTDLWTWPLSDLTGEASRKLAALSEVLNKAREPLGTLAVSAAVDRISKHELLRRAADGMRPGHWINEWMETTGNDVRVLAVLLDRDIPSTRDLVAGRIAIDKTDAHNLAEATGLPAVAWLALEQLWRQPRHAPVTDEDGAWCCERHHREATAKWSPA